ncbi:MAG TPA: tripartite tricarboxylate transporter substrate binding protein [Burkholderiales bacterium]|nr:tripartite tricarboxylate transporter substrate binding protein [Burkholderiales bacterium]
MTTRPLRQLAAAAALLLLNSVTGAQTYPAKPVTVIVPFAVGGSTDIVARIVAQELSTSLGKQVIVDNRTGGGGVIGWGAVARAAPDGYTLLTEELSFAIAAGLIPNLPYDPKSAFAHITNAVSVPHVLVVNPSVKANTVKELVVLAKADPGKLNYGSGGNGTNTHVGGELFKSLTGVEMTHVPYRGAGAAIQDLIAGQVQVLVTSVPTALPYIKSGKLRALMVTSAKRVAVLPDVPSASEAGVPKMLMDFWIGFAAPAGTPQPVIERLNKEIVAALAAPATKKRLAELGLEPVGSTPAQATKLVDDEIQRWSAVVKAANIKPD